MSTSPALSEFPLVLGLDTFGGLIRDESDELAQLEFWPGRRDTIARIAKERGFGVPTRETFDADPGLAGAFYVGAPETVAHGIPRVRALLEESGE